MRKLFRSIAPAQTDPFPVSARIGTFLSAAFVRFEDPFLALARTTLSLPGVSLDRKLSAISTIEKSGEADDVLNAFKSFLDSPAGAVVAPFRESDFPLNMPIKHQVGLASRLVELRNARLESLLNSVSGVFLVFSDLTPSDKADIEAFINNDLGRTNRYAILPTPEASKCRDFLIAQHVRLSAVVNVAKVLFLDARLDSSVSVLLKDVASTSPVLKCPSSNVHPELGYGKNFDLGYGGSEDQMKD
ncbi:hypothetical protein HY990_06790 [Candidatus Micrarchaeota archaeon]|nr:hypothetical protein [Candidatus Micrarchaeota archaeon]